MATVSQEHQSSSGVSVMPLIVFGVLSLIFGLVLGLAAPSMGILPEAASTEAKNTDALFQVLLGIGGVVFFLVQGLVYYAAIAFRAPANDDSDGPNLHGNFLLEVVWTLVPAVIVVFLAIYAYTVWNANTGPVTSTNIVNGDSIRMNVTAQRFAWSFTYETGVRANEINPDGTISEGTGQLIVLSTQDLYVYTGQTVELEMESIDVIHAFWSPEMRVKQDVIPGRLTTIRFSPVQPNDENNPAWQSIMVLGNFNLYASPDATSEILLPAPVLEEGQLPAPVAYGLDNTAAPAEGFIAVKTEDGVTAYIALSETTATGRFNSYRLICAELCGGGHGDMWTEIHMFESQEAFETAWYNPMLAIASIPAGSPIELGEQVIGAYGCSGCHTLNSMGWSGLVGPNLDDVGSRAGAVAVDATAASGNEVLNGAEYLAQSIRHPQDYFATGYNAIMRVFSPADMPQEDLVGVIAFLCTQTGSSPADSTCGLENWSFDEQGRFTGDAAALTEELTAITNEYE